MELLSLFPTLVDVCGLPQPGDQLEGASLVPIIFLTQKVKEKNMNDAIAKIEKLDVSLKPFAKNHCRCRHKKCIW